MHYIPLGDTALRVSRLCLGCMTFGEPDRGEHARTLPEESSRPLIQHAIEGGINFFDTANSYSDGSSEEIVGRALRDFARRDEVVVATKVYHPGRRSGGRTFPGADPALHRRQPAPSRDGLCRPAADPPLGLYHPD